MSLSAPGMGFDRVNDLTEQVKEVIEQEIRPRLSTFALEVELLGIDDDGMVTIYIKKGVERLFDISQEVLEKIVITAIQDRVSEIVKVVFCYGSSGEGWSSGAIFCQTS